MCKISITELIHVLRIIKTLHNCANCKQTIPTKVDDFVLQNFHVHDTTLPQNFIEIISYKVCCGKL